MYPNILPSPLRLRVKTGTLKFTSQIKQKTHFEGCSPSHFDGFSEVLLVSHTQVFSTLSQDSLRDQIQRCALGWSDLPLGPTPLLIAMATRPCQKIPGVKPQVLPKSSRNGGSCRHKSHKNGVIFPAWLCPKLRHPKFYSPNRIHHISPILFQRSQPPAGRTKVPALPSQPGGRQSGPGSHKIGG